MNAATAVDTGALTWGYVLGALLVAFLIGGGLALMAYLDSDTHRRRMARVAHYSRKARR